jgi:hypothetical protein
VRSIMQLPRRAVSFLAVRLPHGGDSFGGGLLWNDSRVSNIVGTARNDDKEPNRHD